MNQVQKFRPFLPSLLGTVVPFVPFWAKTSPLDAVWEPWKETLFFDWISFLLGLPFFLCIPILILQVRRINDSCTANTDIVFAYLFATIATAAMAVVLGLLCRNLYSAMTQPSWKWQDILEFIALLAPSTLLLIANIVLLLRNRRAGIRPAAAAEAFLIGAYIPNVIFCLILVGLYDWKNLNAGAIASVVVCIAYIATIFRLSSGEPKIPAYKASSLDQSATNSRQLIGRNAAESSLMTRAKRDGSRETGG